MWKRNKDRERATKLGKDLDHSLRAEGSKRKSLDDSGEDGGRKEAELDRPSEHRKRRRSSVSGALGR